MDSQGGLDHFLTAQERVYPTVLGELQAGAKRSHWMWFIFPQISGLGMSHTARTFAIAGISEARAYLAHPILGARLRQCSDLVNRHAARSAHDIFGSPDDLKFRSSMTLFAAAGPREPAFTTALANFYAGRPDQVTLDILGRQAAG